MSYNPNSNQHQQYYPGAAPGYPPQPGMPGQAPYPQQPAPYPGYPPAGNQQSYPPAAGYPPTGYPPPAAAFPGYPPQQYQQGYVPVAAGYYPPPGAYPGPGGPFPQQGFPATIPPQQFVPGQQGPPKMAGQTPSEPTLRPSSSFDAEADCKALHKAMKGLGTDEKAIIDVLAKLGLDQRLQLVTTYKTMYGKDLISQLKSELSGNFEDTVVALLKRADYFDAESLHDAMAGAGTNEDTLIEIIFSRTNAEITAIKAAYKTLYKKELEKDVVGDTSGWFKRIMVAGLTGGRQEGGQIDIAKAQADAKTLHEAGAKKWGTDEATFISIFALRSLPQLKATFDEYKRLTNKDIESVIKAEMSGNLESSFLAIAKVANNKNAYFAELLYHAMKGAGTKDRKLVRIVVTRCEKDLGSIKQEFLRMYGKTLESFISDDISGDYKKMILALVNYGSR